MKWKFEIYLVFISVFLIILLAGCNCSDDVDGSNNDDSIEIVRVTNGYAEKYSDGFIKIKRCDKNFADCDKDVTNGCESDITIDRNNCGLCGKICQNPNNASIVECKNSTCQIDYCVSGYIDLDMKYENGCEYKCTKISEKETGENLQDDNCDGFIDNICTYAVDINTHIIASDLKGEVDDLIVGSDTDYTVVAYQVQLSDSTRDLNLTILDSQNRVVSSVNVKNVNSTTEIGGIATLIYNNSVVLFWSENQKDESKIFYMAFNLNGVAISSEKVIYENNSNSENLIAAEYKSLLYLSFETVEQQNKSVILLNFDPANMQLKFKRTVSTTNIDCYGHNIYLLNDMVFVSYWEMRGGSSELVIMKNDLISFQKERFPVYKTNSNAGGTALGYGNGYFFIMWTEQTTSSLGSLYIMITNEYMESLLLKRADFNYDEFGLPVTSYNGNIYGSTFIAIKNNKNYILFSDFDISGAKIQELIISPVSIVNKPFISSQGDDFLIFYSDLNTKMEYFLNMKRVYCIKN